MKTNFFCLLLIADFYKFERRKIEEKISKWKMNCLFAFFFLDGE